MNKIICSKPKVIFAISLLLYSISVFSQKKSESDCEILNYILKKENAAFDQYLANEFVNIAKELNEAHKKYNFQKIDSIKQHIGINDELEKLYPIFNVENFHYILGQEQNKVSGYEQCDKLPRQRSKNKIHISHPVYSKNGDIAFVSINKLTMSYILILTKNKKYWQSNHIIFPRYVAPRPAIK